MSPVTASLVIWSGATIAHVALTARAVRRLVEPGESLDALIFGTVLAVTGSLSLVLHTAAATVGLSLASGTVLLGIWHLGLWIATARSKAASTLPSGLLERIALVLWIAIGLSWIDGASRSAELFGPDAAHYHVPVAVNLAAGGHLLDLPATPHLYPMAGSMVAAWFILPTGDPLLIDLAMLLPFTLIVAALNLVFRTMTGQSGLAWGSWLCLLLFSTPMFRSSSVGAADLWFAAGFVSVLACMAQAWFRLAWSMLGVALLGLSVGVLVGSKASGGPALALLVVGLIGCTIVRRLAGAPRLARPDRPLTTLAVAATLMIGAGGAWLLRNWTLFGSPIAPSGLSIAGFAVFPGETFSRTTYLSVLGELESGSFDLPARLQFFVARWFGSWFLPALALIPVFALDLLLSLAKESRDARWWVRAGVVLQTLFCGAALLWWLAGAPWTALEVSGGLTLRYALPLAALLAAVSYVALFPVSAFFRRWQVVRWAVVSGVALFACVLFWRSLESGPVSSSGLPALGLVWLGTAAVFVLIPALIQNRGGGRREMKRRSRVAAGACLGASVVLAWLVGTRDATARANAAHDWSVQETAYAAGQSSASGWRQIFLAVRTAERANRVSCASRRFFSLVRDDEPMSLQPPEMSSRVYYAGRDVESTRRAGPLRACDYVITTHALEGTDKGRQLVSALVGGGQTAAPLAVGHFVIYADAGR